MPTPLVEIGLIYLPKTGEGPRAPPAPTSNRPAFHFTHQNAFWRENSKTHWYMRVQRVKIKVFKKLLFDKVST